jgi:hypothetical protein
MGSQFQYKVNNFDGKSKKNAKMKRLTMIYVNAKRDNETEIVVSD